MYGYQFGEFLCEDILAYNGLRMFSLLYNTLAARRHSTTLALKCVPAVADFFISTWHGLNKNIIPHFILCYKWGQLVSIVAKARNELLAQNREHFVISSTTTKEHFFSQVVVATWNMVASTVFYITRSKRSHLGFIFNGINRLQYVFALLTTTIYRTYLIKWRPRINAAPVRMNAAFIRNSVQLGIYTIQTITTLSRQKSDRLELETSSCFTYYLEMIYHNCCWNKGSIGNTKNLIKRRLIK